MAFVTVLIAVSLASCKKNYTCTCDVHWIHPLTNVSGSKTVVVEIKGTQKKAETECKEQEQKLDMGASSGVSCKML